MITRIALIALMGAALLPAADRPDRPEKLAFRPIAFEAPRVAAFKATLKNGIPVFLHSDPQGSPLVRINVQFRGGSYLDPKGKEGLASVLGSQWRAGGTEKTSAAALDERLAFLGASLQSSCGPMSGALNLEMLEKDLPEGLELLMEVLTRPTFAQDRLDLCKQQAGLALTSRNDSVTAIAGYQWPILLNGESHFSAVQPTSSSLAGIIREDLLALRVRLLHPDNLVVSVSGRLSRKAMLNLLDQGLGALKALKGAQVSPKVPPPDFIRKPGLYLVDKEVPQSMIRFALPGLRRSDPDWHAALVMNSILGGGGFTSRLMKKIRSDEGLTYGISSSLGEGPFWKGSWSGGLQTKTRSVAYALRLTLAEVERIKAQVVSEDELNTAKEAMIQAFPGDWSDKKAIVNTFATEWLIGWPEDFQASFCSKIQAITREDVQRVARKYLALDQLVVLVVGKTAEAEAGDVKDHPGLLKDVLKTPLVRLPLRDPKTMKPLS